MMNPNASPALRYGLRIAAAAALLTLAAVLAVPVHADLQVNLRKDKVELTDGTVIECIVLMETDKSVMIAVKDPDKEDGVIQRVIPSGKVKKITRGPDEGKIKGLKTDAEMASKVIQGSGYRANDHDEDKPPEINPTGPVEAVQPVTPVKTTDNTPKPLANSKLSPKDIANEYLSRFPDLREAAQVFMGGSDRVGELFQNAQQNDPVLRQQLDGFLTLFLKSIEPPEKASGKQAKPNPNKPPAAKPPAPKPPAPQPK
ncbi:MAG: hypothetical protein HY291_08855 [Planctomycetes bacterium]|nr:hypothetical protein [Planctomycetota bacterium]